MTDETTTTSTGTASGRWWDRLLWQAVAATVSYLLLAVWMTWPMPTDPADVFYGGAGDAFGSAALLRELAETGRPPFLPGTIQDFNAPTGVDVAWVRGLASIGAGSVLWLLTVLTDEITAYNLFALSAFPLSGLAMFLLARKLTGSPAAAYLAGFAFAFYPFAVIKGHGHYEFAHGWVVVLVLWRALELAERPSVRNGLVAGAVTVAAMAWSPYFILLAGVAYAAVGAGALVAAARRGLLRAQVAAQAVGGALIVAYAAVFYLLSRAEAAGQGLRDHALDALNVYSARPWEYVVPHNDHPLLGGWTATWLTEHLHGSNFSESTLYLGLPVLALAAFAVVAAVRGARLADPARRVVALLVLVAVAAVLTSAPPRGEVLGVVVPFPSAAIAEVTTTWRVLARLVVVVMAAVALLAAYGVALVLRDRPRGAQTAITFVLALVVIGDLWPERGGTNPIRPSPVDPVLAKLPPGTAAVYPLVPIDTNFGAMFNQRFHGQRLLNGYEPGSVEEERAQALADPSRPGVVRTLGALGVDYVVIPEIPEAADLEPAEELQLVERTPDGSEIFRVPAQAKRTVLASVSDGFAPAETDVSGTFSWLTAPRGTLTLVGDCTGCRVRVTATLQSFAAPRTVVIRTQEGRTLSRTRVGIDPTTFSFVAPLDTKTTLQLLVDPGPAPVRSVAPGSADARSLAVRVNRLTARRAGPGA